MNISLGIEPERRISVSVVEGGYRETGSDALGYAVDVTDGVFDPANPILARYCGNQRVVAFISPTVNRIYGKRLRAYLDACLPRDMWVVSVLRTGERNKTLDNVVRVCDVARQHRLDRRGLMVAVGGGVVCDVVGLAASLYARGVPYVKINTTLVGQVDVGVGVKTGVNHGGSKNFLGSYYPPYASINDRVFLRTLPTREIRCGMAEVLKMALVRDGHLFETIERHQAALLAPGGEAGVDHIERYVVDRAIQLMLEELAPNLREHNVERLVDFGHTFSPVIEVASGFAIKHGEAVAVDMALSSRIAVLLGLLDESSYRRIVHLIHALGLPVFSSSTCIPSNAERALRDAYDRRGRRVNLVVPVALGAATFLRDRREVPDSVVNQALVDVARCLEFLRATASADPSGSVQFVGASVDGELQVRGEARK